MVYDMSHLSEYPTPCSLFVIKHYIKTSPELHFGGSLLLTWECTVTLYLFKYISINVVARVEQVPITVVAGSEKGPINISRAVKRYPIL